MKPGLKATISSEAVKTGILDGTLIEQGIEANPLSRTYDVKFRVANPSGLLRPGMICNVIVDAPVNVTDTTAQKYIVPVNAVLLSADNRHFVWLAKSGKAQQRFVEIGILLPNGVEIDRGLAAGDSVIVAGMQKICNGTDIQY